MVGVRRLRNELLKNLDGHELIYRVVPHHEDSRLAGRGCARGVDTRFFRTGLLTTGAENRGEDRVKLAASDRLGEPAKKAVHSRFAAHGAHHDDVRCADPGITFNLPRDFFPVENRHLQVGSATR